MLQSELTNMSSEFIFCGKTFCRFSDGSRIDFFSEKLVSASITRVKCHASASITCNNL